MENEKIVQSLSANWFRTNYAFYLNNKIEHNAHIFHITNERLESLKNVGLDIKYQVHCNDNEAFVRLCCNSFPYWEFSGAGKDYKEYLKRFYSPRQAENLYDVRKRLKTKYLKLGKSRSSKYYYGERYNEDYLWLVQHDFSGVDETTVFAETMHFIADTYPELENILRETGIAF